MVFGVTSDGIKPILQNSLSGLLDAVLFYWYILKFNDIVFIS